MKSSNSYVYSVEQFCNTIDGVIIQRGSQTLIAKINIYPLEMFSGDTFVAINSKKYSNTDGGFGNTGNEDSVFGLKGTQNTHDYISKAIRLGASTIVFDDKSLLPDMEPGVNYIFVKDSVLALGLLAKDILKHSKAKIIGVSGSTGKTTLSTCLIHYISQNKKVFSLDSIRITYLGLIWSIIHDLDNTFDWIVLEMQTDGIGQLDRICEIVSLDYAFIVNVRDSHLERFKSQEQLLNEKLALYRGLSPNGKLIINKDDVSLLNWYSSIKDERVITVGKDPDSDFAINYSEFVTNGTLSIFNKYINSNQSTSVKSFGEKELYVNCMLYAFSFTEFKTKELNAYNLSSLSDCVGRFQIFDGKNNSKIIVDSYNASYLSVKYGIDRVSKMDMNKKVLVLGSLLELYDKSESIHRELGKYLNRTNVFDYIVFIGEATLYSMNELRDNEKVNMGHVYSYEKALSMLKTIPLDEKTVMYFKGSGAMRLELLAMNFI